MESLNRLPSYLTSSPYVNVLNLFDPDTNVIAVYEKQPDGSNLFLTTCKLVPVEVKHLQESNGNFLTEKMINQQNAVSTNIHDSTNTKNLPPQQTAVNTFESDVTGMTPIDKSQFDNS